MLFTTGSSSVKEVVIGGGVKAYPNPVASVLYLSEEAASVEVVSLSGQVMYYGNNVTTINVDSYPAGLYILKATDAAGNVNVIKVVKK